MRKMSDIKVGDSVMIECFSAIGTGGLDVVTKITYVSTTSYDVTEDGIGKSKKVSKRIIWCGDHAFDGKTGEALNEPTMYYISL